jgi:hypothetical protein
MSATWVTFFDRSVGYMTEQTATALYTSTLVPWAVAAPRRSTRNEK